jgi:hypothetical protein
MKTEIFESIETGRIIKTTYGIRAGRMLYSCDSDGFVRVYDSIAKHYVTSVSAPACILARVRNIARQAQQEVL